MLFVKQTSRAKPQSRALALTVERPILDNKLHPQAAQHNFTLGPYYYKNLKLNRKGVEISEA